MHGPPRGRVWAGRGEATGRGRCRQDLCSGVMMLLSVGVRGQRSVDRDQEGVKRKRNKVAEGIMGFL